MLSLECAQISILNKIKNIKQVLFSVFYTEKGYEKQALEIINCKEFIQYGFEFSLSA